MATLPGILANLSAGWMLQSNGGDYTPVFGARAKYSKFKSAVSFPSVSFLLRNYPEPVLANEMIVPAAVTSLSILRIA